MKIAVVTTCFRYRSHAHVILENFLEPYLFNGSKVAPKFKIVSMYADQFPVRDMARQVCREYGIQLYSTIAGALCHGDKRKKLNVDAVLLIGEHGQYSFNRFGQKRYPRKRFFDEIVSVMRAGGRTTPIFIDKHLSYRWDWAREMYDTARGLNFPLMAGSSVPLAERRPPLELPRGAKLAEAVSIHGGPHEAYGFHGLEVLQSMVESRAGGEAGVVSVESLEGAALWRGDWSLSLAEAAMAAELGQVPKTLRRVPGETSRESRGAIIRYADGFKATMLNIGQNDFRWNFACRIQGERRLRATTYFGGPWDNRNFFKALSHAIQSFFRTGTAPYPVERTLLTTGLIDAILRARRHRGPLATPHLQIPYRPRNFKSMREMGATWKILTDEIPQPRGIDTFIG